MKHFTIENDNNNITVHGSVKEAEAIADSERFGTEAALAKLAANWPAGRLVGRSLTAFQGNGGEEVQGSRDGGHHWLFTVLTARFAGRYGWACTPHGNIPMSIILPRAKPTYVRAS